MDKELYDWQYDILERPGALSAISHPWNFVHLTHIHYDRVNQEYRVSNFEVCTRRCAYLARRPGRSHNVAEVARRPSS